MLNKKISVKKSIFLTKSDSQLDLFILTLFTGLIFCVWATDLTVVSSHIHYNLKMFSLSNVLSDFVSDTEQNNQRKIY